MPFISSLLIFFMMWAAFVGYVMNIIVLSHATEVSIVIAIRILGIILFPIGCISGFL